MFGIIGRFQIKFHNMEPNSRDLGQIVLEKLASNFGKNFTRTKEFGA